MSFSSGIASTAKEIRKYHVKRRIKELKGSIKMMMKDKLCVPVEWVKTYNESVEELKNL